MVYDIMNDGQRKIYEETLECDFSFEIQGLACFRSTRSTRTVAPARSSGPFPARSHPGAAELPKVFGDLALKPRGMVLVTGPTGSGKSTTLAAAINHLNETEYGHILTVEDPIEFVHESKKCLRTSARSALTRWVFQNA